MPFRFFDNGSENLICFLPAVRSKPIYPYFPRINWAEKLREFDCLYLSDPFQNEAPYQGAGGSWFISQNGVSVLGEISEILSRFFDEKKYRNIIFYGSSMGGYAAIVLGAMRPCSYVIAECPQLYLEKHPGSLEVLNKFCDVEKRQALPSAAEMLKTASNNTVVITLNIYDHHLIDHAWPLMAGLRGIKDELSLKKLDVRVYMDNAYAKGHTALKFEDASRLIQEVKLGFT